MADKISALVKRAKECGWSCDIRRVPVWVSLGSVGSYYDSEKKDKVDVLRKKAESEGRPIEHTCSNFKGTTYYSTVDGTVVHLSNTENRQSYTVEFGPDGLFIRSFTVFGEKKQFVPTGYRNHRIATHSLKYIYEAMGRDSAEGRIARITKCIETSEEYLKGYTDERQKAVKAVEQFESGLRKLIDSGKDFDIVIKYLRPFLGRAHNGTDVESYDSQIRSKKSEIEKYRKELAGLIAGKELK